MSDDNLLTRREFTVEWVLAVLAGATITITGCGDDDDPGTGPSGGGEVGSISANHGHSVQVTSAEISTGQAVSVTFSGNATHTHSISLTAAEVAMIGQNQRVSITSTTNDGHNHTVTFN